ncbi:MAG: hypothetical protein PHW76_06940 [Alphaproteobacteria bacterium]|nr:hypothetical protein [Alphaproteobacteria bacterium]
MARQTYWSFAAFFGVKSATLFSQAAKRIPRALLRRDGSCSSSSVQNLFSKICARKEIFSACAAEMRNVFKKHAATPPENSFLQVLFNQQRRIFGERSSEKRRHE